MTGARLVAAALALGAAGWIVYLWAWASGYRAGLQWNKREAIDLHQRNAILSRKLANSQRRETALLGQVAILEAGMDVSVPEDLWQDFEATS